LLIMGLPVARICSGAAIRPQAPFPKPQTICRNEQFDDPLSISSKKQSEIVVCDALLPPRFVAALPVQRHALCILQ
jgi:hypothetical protein